MESVNFPQANAVFGAPPDMTAEQVGRVPAFMGKTASGSCEGLPCVVVAYKLTVEEIACLAAGGLLYLTQLGGTLAPHFHSFTFEQATNPR